MFHWYNCLNRNIVNYSKMEENKKKEAGKTGIIPDEEIKGSDADKAYDENGDFGKPQQEEKDPEKSDSPPGSDADH